MTGILTFENFNTLKYSSNSLVHSTDIQQDELIESKIKELKKILGNDLFSELSYSDQIFMAETANSIDFGRPIDLLKISLELKDDGVF